MDTKERLNISILNDTYGCLLTPHQTEMIRLYYDLDVSLNEIALEYDISRQAVRDAIQRGEKALEDFEAKLHIVARQSKVVEGLQDIAMSSDKEKVKDKALALIELLEG